MKVALFVEGSVPHGPKDHCAALWNRTLLPALGRAEVDLVVPIGKDAITRLLGLRASTSVAGLDERIAQMVRRALLDPSRDALVIAWDLEPVDRDQTRCAWREKLGVYRGLERSPLPELAGTAWARCAAEKAAALELRRGLPAEGLHHSAVRPGAVVGLCMEPMFEGLLTRDGRALRSVMELDQEPRAWPAAKRWGADERDPSGTLEQAIDAMRELRPRAKIRRILRSIYSEAKDEWCDYLLRGLLADPEQAAAIRAHPIATRLTNVLPPAPQLTRP